MDSHFAKNREHSVSFPCPSSSKILKQIDNTQYLLIGETDFTPRHKRPPLKSNKYKIENIQNFGSLSNIQWYISYSKAQEG